jgi:hypothetical protein
MAAAATHRFPLADAQRALEAVSRPENRAGRHHAPRVTAPNQRDHGGYS